ncbi:MAG: zinc ribbon-containing protein [Pseudomonadota bacterium]
MEKKTSETGTSTNSSTNSSKSNSDESNMDKLVHGYDTMMEQLSAWVEKTDETAGPLLTNGIQDAEKFMHDLGKWSKDEIDLLSRYIKRDIHDVAVNLEKQNKSLAEWLQFDVQLIESKLLEVFSTMTDKTRLELNKLSHLAEREHIWHTGEVTSVGTITCKQCKTQLHYQKAGRIPPCPKCHKTEFVRANNDNLIN